MRSLFSDGFNSLAHVVFGVLGVWYPIVVILFFIYHCIFTHLRTSAWPPPPRNYRGAGQRKN
jgi:hypothetical protein